MCPGSSIPHAPAIVMSMSSSTSHGSAPAGKRSRDARFTAFTGFQRVASGSLPDVAAAVRARMGDGHANTEQILVFSDGDGRVVDLDLRGSESDVRARARASTLADPGPGDGPGGPAGGRAGGKRGPGRPRLGVVGKEVTLLPRHWAWLDAQKGGASATLRRLVDAARRESEGSGRIRRARDAAYRFMAAVAGDLPGYEEAIRALFRGDGDRFAREVESWPPDVRRYGTALAAAALTGGPAEAEDAGRGT